MEKDNVSSESMYLSTLPNQHKKYTSTRSPLDVSDIPGAKSKYLEDRRAYRDTNLDSSDILKSHPKKLIPREVNRPILMLEVDDI